MSIHQLNPSVQTEQTPMAEALQTQQEKVASETRIEQISSTLQNPEGSLIQITQINQAKALLEKTMEQPIPLPLGKVEKRTDIQSAIGEFLTFPEYQTHYPESIQEALMELHAEYNTAFQPLVENNKEFETDYQQAIDSENHAISRIVRFDLVALPPEFLEQAGNLPAEVVKEVLRKNIFEVENAFGMYQLVQRIGITEDQKSVLRKRFEEALNEIRKLTRKKIAILTTNPEKDASVRALEFGKMNTEKPTDQEVYELSGFDKYYSPEDFKAMIEKKGDCEELLVVRSSEPNSKLKNPNHELESNLLNDSELRRIIKANAITLNIDNPEGGSGTLINDSKAYLPEMKMGFLLQDQELSELNSDEFKTFLLSNGINPEEGYKTLRAKPVSCTGAYGQMTLKNKSKSRRNLKNEIKKRGDYILQPEMKTPIFVNENNGEHYTGIDRVFTAIVNGKPTFIGGVRNYISTSNHEAKNGRIHGSKDTIYTEIKG